MSATNRWEGLIRAIGNAARPAPAAATRAPEQEQPFPEAELASLGDAGLLAAPWPSRWGGDDLGDPHVPGATAALYDVLRALGRANLSVARLFEGHMNALELIRRLGREEQRAEVTRAVVGRAELFGLWNSDDPANPARLAGAVLEGSKLFASGAGLVTRSVVGAAGNEPGKAGWQLLVLDLSQAITKVDTSWWQVLGMRESGSHRITLTGTAVGDGELLGAAGDYYLQPWLTYGVARFAAAQVGAAEQLFDTVRAELSGRNRIGDVVQQRRLAEMGIQLESARLWLAGCARQVETHGDLFVDRPSASESPRLEGLLAYFNMARTAVEGACLRVLETAAHCLGASMFISPSPAERIHRDLHVYLRQPAPDAALAQAGRTFANEYLSASSTK